MSKRLKKISVAPSVSPAPAAARPAPAPVSASAWPRPFLDFAGRNGGATFLWPRWLVLRAVGVVYLFIFSGILAEGQALLGPRGIVPLPEFFQQLHARLPGMLEAFTEAPSLFWLSTRPAMIGFLAWSGVLAAVALVLNLWPRAALAACWVLFLSFAATWRVFSPAQLDNLMLEVALLCIPFAPAGFRPGLGAASPPRPIALFMVRWLLFRVMFESGIVKLVAGDHHWRDLTAMEVMYETSPFPTIFGYWDHHLPHAWHLFEIALTFAAELAAPILALFGGRRGRWFAFFTWTVLQIGIQLTSNFGWLNTASIGLGLLLLDDQMLATAATRLRLSRLAAVFTARPPAPSAPAPLPAWRLSALRGALWLHFAFTLVFLAKACGLRPDAMPAIIADTTRAISGFRSVNEFSLYAAFDPVRYQVEFEGSNDAGRTWRPYEYRHLPRPDEIAPFIAPRFLRFEATLQLVVLKGRKSPLLPVVASHLLTRNPEVMALFRRDPFPDRPPTVVRMRGYRLTFTSPATQRRTGDFWRKEFTGDYLPALYLNEQGSVAEFNLAAADEAMRSGRHSEAFRIYDQQFKLGNLDAGFRLAEMLGRGLGVRAQPGQAFSLLTDLAARGEVGALHNVGACHEFGVGVPIDYAKAAATYRAAADRGYLLSLYSLGALHAQDRLSPRDDIAGLAFLLEAIAHAKGDDPASKFVREDRPGHVSRIKGRMSAAAITQAERAAQTRR